MGALTGAITIRRYAVRGDVPTTERILKGIRAHVQVPIDPEGDLEKAIGWADIADPSDTDLSASKVFRDDLVVLGLRVDTLKPPTPVVQRLVSEQMKKLDHRPTRADKCQIKDEVIKSLRKRYYPTIKSVDVVWDVHAKSVLFWTHSKQLNEWLEQMFNRSFGLDLIPLGPGVAAALQQALFPTPEMLMGFPGLPGRPVAGEDCDG